MTSPHDKSSHDTHPQNQDDELQQDDAVIASFFRRSLIVLGIVGLAVLAGYFALSRKPRQDVIVEMQRTAPQQVQTAGEPAPPAAAFVDITTAAGIDFVHVNGAYGDKLLPETMGGGVALFDYDNDGNIDILFVNSSQWPWASAEAAAVRRRGHRLYRNLGDWAFEDVTARVGLDAVQYGMGVAIGDYDADGYKDIYISAVGKNRLYRNDRGKAFTIADTKAAGDDDDWSTSAAFFDMDNDGDLDLFVCNYVKWSREIDFSVDYRLTGIGRAYGPPTNYEGQQSRLFRNDGDSFVDVSAQAGIFVNNAATGLPVGKALAVHAVDIDRDGWLDIIVANDTVQNFVFMNRGGGQFEERGAIMGMAFDNSGNATGAMGVDAVNYTNGGQLAVIIANFANEMSSFYVGNSGAIFTDESNVSGVGPDSRRALSFGLFFFDYDLDGRADLLTANGHVEDDINVVQPSQNHEQAAHLFWNCGSDCRRPFRRVPDESIGDLRAPLVGRGAAYADLDNDGDLDVVITQTGRRPAVLRNDQQQAHRWLQILLVQEGANREAIGAIVEVTSAGVTQRRQIMPARSYLSQVPAMAYFGLGNATETRVTVTWPDGTVSEYNDLQLDRAHTLKR